jgi:hypothetical protein
MTVLVAIPYWGVPGPLIDKAVRHALAQTFQDTVVLVAGDGQRPPVTVRHDRLVVGTFPTNMGAPATQQAMILGSPFAWYAPHGADDWTEPGHIASLVALRRPTAAVGSGSIWYDIPGRTPQLFRSARTYIEFGMFDTRLLRSIGGYNAAEPCGQDSVLISVLVNTAGVRLTARPTYHKLHRDDSLTHHPDTRGGSPLRTGVRLRNREALAHCAAIGWRNRAAIRAYRESLVPAAIQTQLEDRAALVARWLS